MRHRAAWTLLGVLLCSHAAFVQSQEKGPELLNDWYFEWDWALSLQTTQTQSSAFVTLDPDKLTSLDGVLDVQVDYHSFSGLFSLYSEGVYQNNLERTGWGKQESELVIRELVWQDVWSIAEHELDVSLGKLRVDWGVGYAYRPLDLFRPYRRLPIGIVPEEGVGVAALSYYGQTGDWTILATDSHWGQLSSTELDEQSEQRGIGARHYRLLGDSELQGIAYYDDVRHGVVGGSGVGVISPALAWHASALWQHRHLAYRIPGNEMQAVTLEPQGSAVQVLLGANWANEQGHNVIVEYWYDERAWSDDEWHIALSRSARLKAAPLTSGLAASYAQGLNHANLIQHNLMLHWSFDPQAWLSTQSSNDWQTLEDFTPAIDVLYSPQDGGAISTFWLTYLWFDDGSQSVELEFAARFFTGDQQAVFAQTNQENSIAFKIMGKF